MPSSIPPKFVDVNTARSRQGFVNVIGVVVDCLVRTKTKGSSYVVTFTIKDSELDIEPRNGLKIKYFNDSDHLLPDLKVHDAVLLRQIRVRLLQGALIGVASQWDNVPWAIFRQSEDPGSLITPICSPSSTEPTSQEKAYANSLLNSIVQDTALPEQVVKISSNQLETASSVPKRKDRFSLIKDLSTGTFADLVVHVVKTFAEDNMFQLYVTDYTVNKELVQHDKQSNDEGDSDEKQGIPGDELNYISNRRAKREWTGPAGQRTLQVALWHPHDDFARDHVKVDSYVALTNVHIKSGRHLGNMEGIIHEDRHYPDKIHVQLLDNDDDDPRFIELKKRKREYWKTNKPNKRQPLEEESSKKKTKKKLKKKQQSPRLEEGQVEITNSLATNIYGINDNIRSERPVVKPRSISSILSNASHDTLLGPGIQCRLPFQNLCYRTTVRVVDFFPPKIEDFAVRCISRSAMRSDSEISSDDEEGPNSQNHITWEWRFCLLVEDANLIPGQAPERIKLFVSGLDAVYLLKLDAVDLRKTEQTLQQLREKLFILWGDLEERKDASPDGRMDLEDKGAASQKSLTCCVKEYGVPCRCQADDDAMIDEREHQNDCLGWERRFAMFGTTIM